MRVLAQHPPSLTNPRRGIATLEFAMALPFLLLLMVGITWLGYSVIGQSQVLIKAREKTWQQRFEDKAKAPLIFPSSVKAVTNSLYPGDKDYISETATQAVHVSPVFDKAPPPKASNTVLAGSWDHRAMPFTRFPDLELMAKAGASGTGGDVQSLLNLIGNPLGTVEGLGQTFLSTMASQIAGLAGFGSGSGGGSGNVTEKVNNAEQQSKAKEQQEKAADKKKFQDRLDQLGGKVNHSNDKVEVTRTGGPLDLTIKEIQRLENEAKTAKDNANNANNKPPTDTTTTPGANDDAQKKAAEAAAEAQKKAAQAAADANKRDLDLMKGKRARLESDIRDADAELSAAG
jgi:hypothetical protein